ncbi:AhpC/TSA family protein [Pseudoflavitalea sp. G-6-1-2]|uniref:AhpC/TSA family protein n=1 Tax=Pseudoflavitalea sp. G-6-1-2 TaxID=2728841 RepID=UPI00146AEC0F|nr:AhpC/TSA family protein [Pseudoflavitalea sp. G-6-1-2]NML22558.1 AhpC/TSA family protein [Pseudoflavitalea sp. G-6-1-2]
MKYLFLISLCLPVFAVAQKKQSAATFTLDGSIQQAGTLNSFIYLQFKQNGVQQLDSAVIKNGKYSFKGRIAYPTKAVLYVAVPDTTKTYYDRTRLLKPYEYNFYLDAGKLQIETANTLRASTIKGSASQVDADLLEQLLQVPSRRMDSIYRVEGKAAYDKKDSLGIAAYLKKLYQAEDEKDSIRWRFMETHATSGITLDLLIDETRSFLDPAKVAPLFSRMQPALQASAEGKAFAKRIEKAKLTGVGADAPDFVLNDSTGQAIRFSQYKGKLVLLDFWGSWCWPCRMSNPHLKQLYAEYKEQGFEIVAVSHERGGSLQQQQLKWKKAIQEDGLHWVNLMNNDGTHPDDVTKLYDVTAFPTKLLIGRDGRIIRRLVGNTTTKQDALEQLIKEHLAEPAKN